MPSRPPGRIVAVSCPARGCEVVVETVEELVVHLEPEHPQTWAMIRAACRSEQGHERRRFRAEITRDLGPHPAA